MPTDPDTEPGPDVDSTSKRRGDRLRNLVIGLVPLTGALIALVELFWREYLSQIGVRPEELDVDPTTRIAYVFFTASFLVGLIGPQAFVGSWLDLITHTVNERRRQWLQRHRKTSHLVLAVLTFTVTVAIASLTQLLFPLFVGPLVASLLLAKMFDLDDDLPAVLRITRLRPGATLASAAAIFVVFLAVMSYQIYATGPEFDARGEVEGLATAVLAFDAEPVRATDLHSDSTTELLFLGGNHDYYVLVDPCDDDRVDYVPAGETKLTVIEQVRCDRTTPSTGS